MKTTTFILAAIFALQVTSIFASNNETGNSANTNSNPTIVSLIPTTPFEADFSDIVPEPAFNLKSLSPVTPDSADFTEEATETVATIFNLAPTTPNTAEFEEITIEQSNVVSIVPVTPAEADFE